MKPLATWDDCVKRSIVEQSWVEELWVAGG